MRGDLQPRKEALDEVQEAEISDSVRRVWRGNSCITQAEFLRSADRHGDGRSEEGGNRQHGRVRRRCRQGGAQRGLRVCHIVSGQGNLLMTQRSANQSTSSYDLRNMNARIDRPSSDDGKLLITSSVATASDRGPAAE